MTRDPEERPDMLAGVEEESDEPDPADVEEFEPERIPAAEFHLVTPGELDPDDTYVEGVDAEDDR